MDSADLVHGEAPPRSRGRRVAAAPSASRRPVASADVLAAVALAGAAAALRWPRLGPSSLWLDDAWVALVARAGVDDLPALGFTAPGFATLLWSWFQVVGFSEVRAQLLPFLAGAVGPAWCYAVARRGGLGRPGALVAGVAVVVAPLHVTYATRVKQYTLDAVLATTVVAAGWAVVRRPRDVRRWWVLCGVAIGATVLSAAVAPYVAAAYGVGLGALFATRRRRHTSAQVWRTAFASVGGYALFALAWWAAVLRPAVSDDLLAYWSNHTLDLGAGPVAVTGQLRDAMVAVLGGFSPLPVAVTAVALAGAVVVTLRTRRALGLLLVSPAAVAVALSAAGQTPLGGGRTDIYLFPSFALLLAAAADAAMARGLRPGRDRARGRGRARSRHDPWAIAAVVAVGVALAVVAPAPDPYPESDVRPLVATLEERIEPGDRVVVYSATRWAFALYTGRPLSFHRAPEAMPGFGVHVGGDDLRVLAPHRDAPEGYRADVDEATAGATRVWLIASHWGDDIPVLEEAMARTGLRHQERIEFSGAFLSRWER